MSALDILADDERALLRPGPPPAGCDAMRAKLTDARFSDPDWIFERKLDGVRCVAVRDGAGRGCGRATTSRWTPAIPRSPRRSRRQASRASRSTARSSPSPAGRPASRVLPQRGHRPVAVFYYVFDVLWIDGQDLRALPLRSRKRLLRELLGFEATCA